MHVYPNKHVSTIFQKPEIMANKHGAGNEEDDESDEDTTVSLYTIIIYLNSDDYLDSLNITTACRQ